LSLRKRSDEAIFLIKHFLLFKRKARKVLFLILYVFKFAKAFYLAKSTKSLVYFVNSIVYLIYIFFNAKPAKFFNTKCFKFASPFHLAKHIDNFDSSVPDIQFEYFPTPLRSVQILRSLRKNPLILKQYCLNPNNPNTFNLNDKNIRIHIIENFRLHLKVQIIILKTGL